MSTRFTVVIPTRNRCDTLEWALKTCVTQAYDNLEILVSDNYSADRTEEVARSFDDPRIRYLNTGRRLSMTDNFEFALSQVTDGFVICIGDDDGLLPNALNELDTIITEQRCHAIAWRKPLYFWPTFIDPHYANTLTLSISPHDRVTSEDCAGALRAVVDFKMLYTMLPGIYHGCVDLTTLRATAKRSGRFFHSSIPDAYSAIAVTCALERYHFSTKPFSILGLSGHSAGSGYFSLSKNAGEDKDNAGVMWLKENSTPFHEDLVMFPSLPILSAEAFLQVQDHMDCRQMPHLSLERLIDVAVKDESLLLDPDRYRNLVGVVKQIAALHGLETYADEIIAQYHYRSVPVLVRAAFRLIFAGTLSLPGAKLGIGTIYDASLWCDHIRTLYRPWYIRGVMHLNSYLERTKHILRKARESRR